MWCSLPNHLGAHAHSDQLSFELWLNGNPIISETGTSTYKLGKLRKFKEVQLRIIQYN